MSTKIATGITLLLIGLGFLLFSLAVDNYSNIEQISGAGAHMFFSWFFLIGVCSIVLTLINKKFKEGRHNLLIFSITFTTIGLVGNAIVLLFTHPPDGIAGVLYYIGHGLAILGITLLLLAIYQKYNDEIEDNYKDIDAVAGGTVFLCVGLLFIVITGIIDLIYHGVTVIMNAGFSWTLITYSIGILLLVIGLAIYIHSLKSKGS